MSNLADERQLQRLQYIDLCAYVLGFVNRKSLMNCFDVKEAWATKDFTAYQMRSGGNLIYDHGMKAYKPVQHFNPVFKHDINDVIELICEGKQSFICEPRFANNAYSYSIKNIEPHLANIYSVFRSIHLGNNVDVDYISRSSGKTSRLIAPHSLIKTGCFAYVRAFDHLSGEFRSFKLNRIIGSKHVNSKPIECERKNSDDEWNRDVRVVIAVNGNLENKEAIEFDYGLIDGKLEITIKKALLMYFLMDWNIAPEGFDNLPSELFPLRVDSIS